jgi:hypothetical protein
MMAPYTEGFSILRDLQVRCSLFFQMDHSHPFTKEKFYQSFRLCNDLEWIYFGNLGLASFEALVPRTASFWLLTIHINSYTIFIETRNSKPCDLKNMNDC